MNNLNDELLTAHVELIKAQRTGVNIKEATDTYERLYKEWMNKVNG